MRTLAATVTLICIALGFGAALGMSQFFGLLSLLVALVGEAVFPAAIVAAALYSQGYRQTFFIGVGVAMAFRALATGGILGGANRPSLLTAISIAIYLAGYCSAGLIAVWVRKVCERKS